MEVKRLVVGEMEANCYLILCGDGKEGLIIDPGDEAERILKEILHWQVRIRYIINTHGHIDHIGANATLKEKLEENPPLLIHSRDGEMLTDPQKNLSLLMGSPFTSPPPDAFLEEGSIIECGNTLFRVLHTPGHTEGSISLIQDKTIFTGDTLFSGSVGRTDFPGGSWKRLMESIREKILILPEETLILPGHGDYSTVGKEKRENPFFKEDYGQFA